MYFNRFIDTIEQNGGLITPIIANYILMDHAIKELNMLDRYQRYNNYNVPIQNRELPVTSNKINNKLVNDYFSEIVDTKVGYMYGMPIVYDLDGAAPQYDEAVKRIETFRKVNNLDDMNAETGKYSAICGYAAALCYIDEEGQERVMRVDPWECIFIATHEMTEPKYAIRYYWRYENNGMMRRLKVQFYDSKNVTTLIGDNAGSLEIVDGPTPHMFDYVPLFGIPNNTELLGDGDKVFSLIDAYDRSISDMNSEIEQFRLAYMLFIGYEPTVEQIDAMKQTGALWIPTADSGEDIKFLTKTLDHLAVDSHLDRLEKNIVRFAKHVNFTDEHFAGNVSGVAMRFKLFALETKAKISERKHEAAQRYMFKVIASAWAKKGFALDPNMLDVKYTRNIPVNLADEADFASKMNGIISKTTLLSQLSFITDVEEEMQNIQEEQAGQIDLSQYADPNKVQLSKGGKDGQTGPGINDIGAGANGSSTATDLMAGV